MLKVIVVLVLWAMSVVLFVWVVLVGVMAVLVLWVRSVVLFVWVVVLVGVMAVLVLWLMSVVLVFSVTPAVDVSLRLAEVEGGAVEVTICFVTAQNNSRPAIQDRRFL